MRPSDGNTGKLWWRIFPHFQHRIFCYGTQSVIYRVISLCEPQNDNHVQL